MYQVIQMYGDNEPWWFFENWQKDILAMKQFSTFEDAKKEYLQEFCDLTSQYTYSNTRKNYLAAFWNDKEDRWCEECDEDLQQFKGLALLYNQEVVTEELTENIYQASDCCKKVKACKILGQ